MPFDAPWAIDGVPISADTMRVESHNAARGNEGVIGATDLAVRQLDQAGPQVMVLPGAFNAKQRAPGLPSQMYTDRAPDVTYVDIGATGSAGGRSDMIVARIGDPTVAGGPQPPSDPTGPYAWPEVISGVADGARTIAEAGKAGWTAIPLARIDIPANMSAITQSMIVDLRKVANPNRDRDIYTYALSTSQAEVQTATSTAGEYWPNLARWDLAIPEWATRAKIVATWAGVLAPAGNAVGRVWVGIGSQTSPNTVTSQQIRYDTPNASQGSRMAIIAADDVAIPASMRGTVQRFGMRAYNESASSSSARIGVDWASAIILDIEFAETPVSEQVI